MLETEPKIREEFVKTGKVKYVFHHILDLGSDRHSQAAECAGDQGQFWPMHELLYEQQDKLTGRNLDAALIGLARELKLDEAQFTQCLTSNKYAKLVKDAHDTAKAQGIRIRPTFQIGQRRIQGALPWPQFQALLAEVTQ